MSGLILSLKYLNIIYRKIKILHLRKIKLMSIIKMMIIVNIIFKMRITIKINILKMIIKKLFKIKKIQNNYIIVNYEFIKIK